MSKMANLQLAILVLAVAIGCFMMAPVSGFIHIVGGKHGWSVPDNKTYYEDWARPRTFGLGDRLVFPCRPGANNVMIVDKEDFDGCTENHVISMFYDGPVIVNITRTGDYYFFNGLGKHCEAGQKLHVHVGDKEGSSGEQLPFKLVEKTSTDGPAPSPTSEASAITIRNLGVVSGLVTFLLWRFI